jgi:hypothetical protein
MSASGDISVLHQSSHCNLKVAVSVSDNDKDALCISCLGPDR